MKFNQALSYKFLLPVGIILWFFFTSGALGLLGFFLTLMGVIDVVRQLSKRKKKKTKEK